MKAGASESAAAQAVEALRKFKDGESPNWAIASHSLRVITPDQVEAARWISANLPKFQTSLSRLNYDGVEHHQEILREIGDRLPETSPQKRGPKSKVPRKEIILELIKIYETATSRAAGRSTNLATREADGPFVRVVKAAFDYLEIADRSGLDDAIRDAIEAHKAAMGKLSEK